MGVKFTRLVDEDAIPTKVSQLENDSNYQNEEQVNEKFNDVKTIAEEALSIAQKRIKGTVFDTYSTMLDYLKNASSSEFKIGDQLLIKELDVPDYWISGVLDNNSGIYGYYDISILETEKVDLTNYDTSAEVDEKISSEIEPINSNVNELETSVNDINKKIGDYEASSEPTVVPNSGYVENVYLNINLTVDEVVSVLSNITVYTDTAPKNYFLCVSDGFMEGIGNMLSVSNDGDDYIIRSSNGVIFSTGIFTYENIDFVGWKDGFDGVLSFDTNVLSSVDPGVGGVIAVGSENDKLTSLFSITPFSSGSTIAEDIKELQSNVEEINSSIGDINAILDILNGEA